MAETTDAEKAEKLKKFIAETAADDNVANYYLQSEKWNLESAIAGFKELKLAEEKRLESRAAVLENDVRPATTGSKGRDGRVGPLRRGISMANTELVANVREKLVNSELSNRLDTSFVLPNITIVKEPDLVHFLKNDLIDKATYQSLTKADVLNWWAEPKTSACRKLFPMSTVGDGNCLLHAVSLAMWGFHDRLLTLRRALHKSLTTESAKGAFKRRWMYQQWKLNMDAGGLCFTHQEWEDEWAGMVRLASDKPRNQPKAASPSRKISRQYSIAIATHYDDAPKRTDSQGSDSFESLEEFHVFALAHVLRRPIIVVSDVMLRDLEGQPLQPIHFGGIYLPLECDPSTCSKFPLVLGYDSGHFAALVPAEGEDMATNKTTLLSNIPLTRSNFELLPLHFIIDPGPVWPLTKDDSKKKKLPEMSKQDKLAVLSRYLHITKVERFNKGSSIIPSFQGSDISECELDASDLGSLYRKKSKEGKPFIAKAFENITTLVTGHTNATKTSPRVQRRNSGNSLYTAKLNMANRPEYFDEMIKNYIASARNKLREMQKNNDQQQQQAPGRVKCATPSCSFFGTSTTNYLCSKCYKYQRDFTKVHKSMPSLQEDKPPLLKIANRQLSNPEKVDCNDSLIDFDDRIPSNPFRPATAPPQEEIMDERQFTSSKSFDSVLDSVLFSQTGNPTPSAPFQSVYQHYLPEEQSSAAPQASAARSSTRDQLDDFDPLKNGSLDPALRTICKGAGCKIFGAQEHNGFCFSCFDRQYNKTGYV